MTRLTLYRIAIKGISQHNIRFIAKLPHANRGATDKKSDFHVLFHPLSMTNFSTKNHDNDSGDSMIAAFLRQTFVFDVEFPEFACGLEEMWVRSAITHVLLLSLYKVPSFMA